MSGNTSYRGRPSGLSLSGILRDLSVSWKLLLDPAVPGLLKLLLPVAALVYWISPLDIIPGMPLDDLAILLLAARLFVSLAPRDSVYRAYSGGSSRASQDQSHSHQGEQTTSHADDDGDVIDTTWRIVD
jgi:uncharacterized membrane protein YkvA (DUF1232 family)